MLDSPAVAIGRRRQHSDGLRDAFEDFAGFAVVVIHAVHDQGLVLCTDELDTLLGVRHLSGLVLNGAADSPIIGSFAGREFYRRIKQTLDPNGRFPDYIEEHE